ncbi:hypothetical protein [Enhygromyxa salina]|nr:hypothetical protein [Enhygromyxa salina]
MNDVATEILRACAAEAHSRRPIRYRGAELELEVVDVLRADEATLERLRAELTTIMLAAYATAPQAIRAGTASGPAEYLDHVLDHRVFGVFNTVVLVHAADGPIAFARGHVCRQPVLGQELEIIRAGAHVTAEHQAQSLSSLAFTVAALRYARTHLSIDVPRYYVGLCANPVSYGFIHRRAARMHPSPERSGDAVMRALCEEGLAGEQRCGHLIAKPLATRLDDRLRAYVATTDDPLIRFFLEQNPDFEEGYALPIVVQLRPLDFTYAMGMHGWLTARKLARRLQLGL